MFVAFQLATFVGLQLLLLTRVSLATTSRYSADMLASFELLRSECLQGSFAGTPSLVGHLQLARDSNISCLNSNGLSAYAYSSQNIAAVKSNLSSSHSYLTIEMWIKVANTSNIETEVFSVGNYALSSPSTASLAITYKHQHGRSSFYVSAGSSSSRSTLSPSYVPSTVDITSIVHVVARIEYNAVSFPPFGTFYMVSSNFTFNDQTNTSDSHQYSYLSSNIYAPSTWDGSYRLTLLRSSKASDPTDLNIYYFALHASKLNQRQISQNFAFGLTDSLPVVASCAATVDEDGMTGSHYTSPAYYRKPVPATELAVVSFKAFDLDEQSYSPNYNASAEQLHIEVLALNSSAGSFFFHDGTPLSAGAVVTKNDTHGKGVYGIRFRPLYNRHSRTTGAVYTSVTYRAIDGTTGIASASNATLSIYVTAIDDPPYVLAGYSATAVAGLLAKHTLSGGDVDSTVTAAYITALPKNGTIHHVASNGSVLAALTAPGYLDRNGTSVFTFAYRYTGSQHLPSGQTSGLIATDTFNFMLEDKEGRLSEEANFTLQVYSSLTASASTYTAASPVASQGSIAALTLYGADTSEAKRNVTLQIVSLPSRGVLYASASGGTALAAGAQLSSTITSSKYSAGKGTQVYYLSSGSSFTYPTTSWNGSTIGGLPTADSFTFRTISSDGSASLPATQYVGVKNVNGPSEISFTYEGDWSGGEIKIYAYSTSNSDKKTSATLTGFSISDEDRGIDIIRAHVKVSSSGGKVTLNQAKVSQLDFSSSTYCLSSSKWQCKGSGYYNSEMIFLGTPDAIEAALNGLKYVSLLPNRIDIVNITLYDGVGDGCFTTSSILGSSRSVRPSCYIRRVSIPITVLGYAGLGDGSDTLFANSESSMRTKIIVLCCCIAFGLILCRCTYLYAKKHLQLALFAARIARRLLKRFLPLNKDDDPLADGHVLGSADCALEEGLGSADSARDKLRQDFLSAFGRRSTIRMGRNSVTRRSRLEKEKDESTSQDTASDDSCPSASGDAVDEGEVVLDLHQQEEEEEQERVREEEQERVAQEVLRERETLWAQEVDSCKTYIFDLERRLAEQARIMAELIDKNRDLVLKQEMQVHAAPCQSTCEAPVPGEYSSKYVVYTEFGGAAVDI